MASVKTNYVYISSLLYITLTAFIASHKICSTRLLFAYTKTSHSVKAMSQFSTKQFLENFRNDSLNITFHFFCHMSAAGMNFAFLGLSSVHKLSPTHPSQQHMKTRDTAPTFAWPQSFIFSSVETLKSLVHTAPSKTKRHFNNAFLCLSNHSQPHRDLWKGVTVRDQTWAMIALIQVEDILTIYCKMWPKKQQ